MPIKEGYKPVKQAPRRMSKEIEEKVKEEIERLVKAGFIRPAKYVEWLANIVPVLKAITKAVRCCVDYRNINSTTPKDEYHMPMADLSIDAVAKHKVLSFMDGNAGYNQIKMAQEDIHKTAFRCPGHVGAYEYLVMPFRLKNAGATYKRAMNAIFHDLIGHNMEVYIDDIVVKSKTEEQHLIDLRQVLTRMRIHKLKMNPKKCAFGVRAGNFLGFLVHQRGKIQPLTLLLRLKDKENFEWGPPYQEAFDSIKIYLTSPPVLVPPQRGKPLKLYISASKKSIESLLAQNNEGGKEQAVYYLSRILTEVETRYSLVERLCLALYFTANKLRHYMLPCHVHIIAKTDVIKYMLSKPMLTGRIGKWILALSEFSFQYVPQKAVKGQAIADFLAKYQESRDEVLNIPRTLEVTNVWIPPSQGVSGKEEWIQQEIKRVASLWITPWKLYFDGATEVEVFGDSELVINQLNGEFKCRHITMAGYYLAATQLLSYWDSEISVGHVPRGTNPAANEMAQLASGVPIQERKYGVDIEVQRRNLPSTLEMGFSLDIMVLETEVEDWRSLIIRHLKDPSSPTSKKDRQQATKYVLWTKDLLRKTPDGLLLKSLGQEESMRVMAEVHEGICEAHQAGTKMRWLLRRYGYFWPDMEKDCKSYARGCEECQRHGSLQHIYPASSKGHTFIIVATDYFTKWVEASAVRSITSATVKTFIETKILYRFGVPETIVTDRGPSFISKEVEEFASKYKIKMIQSSPYYPQSNGQVESSNKILVNIIKRMVMDSPERWHEKLGNTLWAYRTSKRAGTGTTPYALTFRQEAVLPMEINVSYVRIQNQFRLHSEEYIEAICQGIEDLDVARIEALNQIQEGKKAVARAYNKKVKVKSFKEEDLVWKTVLPL
ncbi:hypothetical protein ACFX13_027331 [Malus domestica]